MTEFAIHPGIYSTGPHKGLLPMLETIWTKRIKPGDGKFFIVSGFGNFNGGVRFYNVFREHVQKGGEVIAIFSGSTSQRLTSQQIVSELLSCGVKVYVVNRKRLLHAKCYGVQNDKECSLIVSSGNFTGPGLSQNAEASLLLDSDSTQKIKFSWIEMTEAILTQKWEIYQPSVSRMTDPAWKLLYNEKVELPQIDETQQKTLIITLGAHDTARIRASRGSIAGLGSQYFWLSKDSFDFFPPLLISNKRGYKPTFSAFIDINFIDIQSKENVRVTFEAGNNFDFRLGTGALRYSKLAKPGDIAAITRIGESNYELRIIPQESRNYKKLSPYAVNFIGHRGKRYGYLPNDEFFHILK